MRIPPKVAIAAARILVVNFVIAALSNKSTKPTAKTTAAVEKRSFKNRSF